MKVSENQPSWPIVEIKDLEGETTGLVITLDFLGVDWPDRLDSSEGRRGNCGELSANSALHPGTYLLPPGPFSEEIFSFGLFSDQDHESSGRRCRL